MTIINLIGTILNELSDEVEEMPTPATDESIADVIRIFKMDFNVSIPKEYIDILKLSDGLIFNGLTIWPTHKYWYFKESLVQANHNLQASLSNDYVYYGTRDEELYVYNVKEGKYAAIEYVAEAEWESFPSSGDMFEFMLKRALD